MRIGRIFDIDICINKFLIIIAAIVLLTGNGREFAAIFLILFIHEMAHVVMARALQLKVSEIELLPFGGAVKIQSVFELNPVNEILIAVAGPSSNFLMLAGYYLLINTSLIEHSNMSGFFINANLLLAGFNLLPALPLDGGRILRAILSRDLGMKKATQIASGGGLGLALFLAMTGIYALYYRVFNYSLFVMALFLAYSAYKERKSATYILLRDITYKKESLLKEGSLNIREVAVMYNLPLKDVIKKFSPRRYHYVQVLDEQLGERGELSESQIVRGLLDYGIHVPISRLLR